MLCFDDVYIRIALNLMSGVNVKMNATHFAEGNTNTKTTRPMPNQLVKNLKKSF